MKSIGWSFKKLAILPKSNVPEVWCPMTAEFYSHYLRSSITITFFTERFKKSAGYIAKCEVALTARIRSRVQSRAEPFLFAVFKIDKKFCLGVFLAQKHEFDVFITLKPPKNEFFQFLQKRLNLHKN